MLLKVVVYMKVKRLHVFGDSKLLMDWTNGKNNISNLELEPIFNMIVKNKLIF